MNDPYILLGIRTRWQEHKIYQGLTLKKTMRIFSFRNIPIIFEGAVSVVSKSLMSFKTVFSANTWIFDFSRILKGNLPITYLTLVYQLKCHHGEKLKWLVIQDILVTINFSTYLNNCPQKELYVTLVSSTIVPITCVQSKQD